MIYIGHYVSVLYIFLYISACIQAAEAAEREKRIQEPSRQVEQQRAAEKSAAAGSSQRSDQYSHDTRDDDEEERRTRSESLRKQRAAVS